MKNKTRRLAAFLLSAAVVITAVPGMQERVYAQKTGGYTESPKSENVPVVKETKSRLKKAEAVPSAYMNKLSELTIRYPGVRDQGKYDTCWAFSAIGLAEFDLIADNQTADKSIDLSELQLAYFTYNNVYILQMCHILIKSITFCQCRGGRCQGVRYTVFVRHPFPLQKRPAREIQISAHGQIIFMVHNI